MGTALWAAVGVVTVGVGILAAPGVPAHAESAAVTIAALEAQGFDVSVDRIGSAPLDRCVVTNVRNAKEHTRLVQLDDRNHRNVFTPIIVRRTITVSLDCTG